MIIPSYLDLLIFILFKYRKIHKDMFQGIVDIFYEKTGIYLDKEKDKDDELWEKIYVGSKYYDSNKKHIRYKHTLWSDLWGSLQSERDIRINRVINLLRSYNLHIDDDIIDEYRKKMNEYCVYDSICFEKGFDKCFWCKKFKLKK